MPACVASVHRCRERVEAFNERLDAKEKQRKRRRKEGSLHDEANDGTKEPGFGGDKWWIRKGMVPCVFVIMWWVFGGELLLRLREERGIEADTLLQST